MTRLLLPTRPRQRSIRSHASAGPLRSVLRAGGESALHPLADAPVAPGKGHPARPGQLHAAEGREELGQGPELVWRARPLDGQRLVRDVEDPDPEHPADLEDSGPGVAL